MTSPPDDDLAIRAGRAAYQALDQARTERMTSLMQAEQRMGDAALAVILPAGMMAIPETELRRLRKVEGAAREAMVAYWDLDRDDMTPMTRIVERLEALLPAGDPGEEGA